MAFIEPMHRNKPNITYLLTHVVYWDNDNERSDMDDNTGNNVKNNDSEPFDPGRFE